MHGFTDSQADLGMTSTRDVGVDGAVAVKGNASTIPHGYRQLPYAQSLKDPNPTITPVPGLHL